MSVVHDPGGLGFRIETLWAFVAVHEDGDEGVTGFLAVDGTWMPMVAADRVRVDLLRPMAARIAKESGKPIRLVRLAGRVDEEEFLP